MTKPLFPPLQVVTDPSCARTETRTNLFVLATLEAGGVSNDVRVRDISRKGALLQGVALPPAGARCVLMRGDIRLDGTIIWVARGKAGIRFEGHTDVAEWINRGKTESQSAPSAVTHLNAPGAETTAGIRGSNGEFAMGLAQLASALKCAEEKLALDPLVAAGHQDSLRVLSAIAEVLNARAGDP